MSLKILSEQDSRNLTGIHKDLNESALRDRNSYYNDEKIDALRQLGIQGLEAGWGPKFFIASDHMTIPAFYGASSIFIVAEKGVIIKRLGHNKLVELNPSVVKFKSTYVRSDLFLDRSKCVGQLDLIENSKDLRAMVTILAHHGNEIFDDLAKEIWDIACRLVNEKTRYSDTDVVEDLFDIKLPYDIEVATNSIIGQKEHAVLTTLIDNITVVQNQKDFLDLAAEMFKKQIFDHVRPVVQVNNESKPKKRLKPAML